MSKEQAGKEPESLIPYEMTPLGWLVRRGLVHPVTRSVVLLWFIGACKFGYLALLLFIRLSDSAVVPG